MPRIYDLPDPMPNTTLSVINKFDPNQWDDPDVQCSSEYRTIYEHAFSVWDSNSKEPRSERCKYVRASLIEMREYLNDLIGE